MYLLNGSGKSSGPFSPREHMGPQPGGQQLPWLLEMRPGPSLPCSIPQDRSGVSKRGSALSGAESLWGPAWGSSLQVLGAGREEETGEKTSWSGLDGGMDLPCSRAETEAAPWAQGQGCWAGNTRDAHCSSSTFRSQAALAHLGTGWAGGQGRDGRAWVPAGPGPQSQLAVLICTHH